MCSHLLTHTRTRSRIHHLTPAQREPVAFRDPPSETRPPRPSEQASEPSPLHPSRGSTFTLSGGCALASDSDPHTHRYPCSPRSHTHTHTHMDTSLLRSRLKPVQLDSTIPCSCSHSNSNRISPPRTQHTSPRKGLHVRAKHVAPLTCVAPSKYASTGTSRRMPQKEVARCTSKNTPRYALLHTNRAFPSTPITLKHCTVTQRPARHVNESHCLSRLHTWTSKPIDRLSSIQNSKPSSHILAVLSVSGGNSVCVNICLQTYQTYW